MGNPIENYQRVGHGKDSRGPGVNPFVPKEARTRTLPKYPKIKKPLEGLDASQPWPSLELHVGSFPIRPIVAKDASLLIIVAPERVTELRAELTQGVPKDQRDQIPDVRDVICQGGGDDRPDQAAVHLHMADLPDNGAINPLHGIAISMGAAVAASRELRDGGRVLVCCHRGLNRGPFIAGLTLMMLGAGAQDAIEALRRARGKDALSNVAFVRTLERFLAPQITRRRNEGDES